MAGTQQNRTAQAKPDRRQALILAAFNSIAQKGFEGLRVRGVAAQVGINGATLHHYFQTKEDLIRAVVEYAITRLRATMEGQDLQGNPAEQLRMHLTRLYRLMQEEPALFVVLSEMNLRSQRDPVLEYLVRQEDVWHQRLASILQAGIQQGVWPDDLDPQAAAAAIITLMEGASLWAVTYPERGKQAVNQLEKWLQIV